MEKMPFRELSAGVRQQKRCYELTLELPAEWFG